MNKDKRRDHNQRTRGLIEIPAETVPEGTRCISLKIPDSDAATRQLFGMLSQLTYWKNYARDAGHNGALWATAWRAALAANAPIGACELPVQIRACALDCGIQYSTDGGETWSECISLAGCIEDIAKGVIHDYIEDGTLAGGGQKPPGGYVPVDSCQTFHVELLADQIWHCPVPIAAGYTITVSNATGGWSDGTLAWYCPDGARYLLGACSEQLHSHEAGDPSATAWHMAIVGNFNTTYFDALAGAYQVSPGIADTEFFIQANDGSLGDNQGSIRFDVEVCRPAGASCDNETYDFSDNALHGWRAMTENEFDLISYYNANTTDWRWAPAGGMVYGEGYFAGNYGLSGVLELASTCALDSVRVTTPNIGISQHLVAIWLRQAGIWTVYDVHQINANSSWTFQLDKTDVQAIAVTAYGDWALGVLKVETFYD